MSAVLKINAINIIIKADGFSADEAALKIGVDDPGGLRCGCPICYRPGTGFLRPDSKKCQKIWLKLADDLKLTKIVEDVQNIKDWKNSSFMENIDLDELYRVSNHPVHIFDEKGLLSPTALIPFCQLGNEFQGNTTDHFSVPVCRGFKAKIHNKKLCYEIKVGPKRMLQ